MTDHTYIPPATVLAAFQARAAADRAGTKADHPHITITIREIG